MPSEWHLRRDPLPRESDPREVPPFLQAFRLLSSTITIHSATFHALPGQSRCTRLPDSGFPAAVNCQSGGTRLLSSMPLLAFSWSALLLSWLRRLGIKTQQVVQVLDVCAQQQVSLLERRRWPQQSTSRHQSRRARFWVPSFPKGTGHLPRGITHTPQSVPKQSEKNSEVLRERSGLCHPCQKPVHRRAGS